MSNLLRTKCVIVGNCTVGKTALTQTFLSDGRQFPKNYNMVRSKFINECIDELGGGSLQVSASC